MKADGKTLFDALCEYTEGGTLPMHMPGHKRAADRCLSALGAAYDITEIDGFDDLAEPHSILLESEEYAARLWGAEKSFFLVNGSTEGILAGIYAGATRGARIIMARNCHKSVYNAVELLGISPVYVKPEFVAEIGLTCSVKPEKVLEALDENPDCRLVVITSPTYEGVISDISAIAEICHGHGAALMVDEAHGAHLGLFGVFPTGAVECGADIVVQSLHKTLSSLTQTAIMHISGSLVDAEKIQRAVSVFGTSSPSYLLMSSIDNCIKKLDERKLVKWRKLISANADAFSALAKFHMLGYDGEKREAIFALDPSKLTLLCGGTDYSGFTLAKALRDKYKIEIEMSAPSHIVAMSGEGDTDETIARFAAALKELDRAAINTVKKKCDSVPLPVRACTPSEALSAKSFLCPAEAAVGRISCEYIYAYPPGIPVVVPGERLSEEIITVIKELYESGASLRSTAHKAPQMFKVIEI